MTATIGSVTCEVDEGDPPVIRVVPGDIGPERSPDGTAMATLMISGEHAVLNLGTRWWPSEEELNAVRNAVAAKRERPSSDYLVNTANLWGIVVSLVLTDGGGAPVELARGRSSNAPPFTAVLSADVGAHRDVLRRAFLGERGLLHARLAAELTPTGTATASTTGIRDSAHRTTTGADGTTVHVSAGSAVHRTTATARPGTVAIERTADVADWLRGSPGRHVVIADPRPGTGSPTDAGPAGRPVRLGFDATGAPVERITLSGSGDPVDLVPGGAAVPVDAAEGLDVTTHYATGAPYRVALPHRDDGWTLRAADLGLVEVVVDGGRLRDASATRVVLQVFYQPDDRGTPERLTLVFTDDVWMFRWFVVSRADGLAGALRLRLGEVVPEGVDAGPRTIDTTTPTVRI